MTESLRPDCVRCAVPKRSEFLIAFTYEGFDYEMPLCEKHVEMFDREMTGWTRLAKEIGPTPAKTATTRPKNGNGSAGAKIEFPVSFGGYITDDGRAISPRDLIGDDALAYTLSEHALQRMTLRQVTKNEVYATISNPKIMRGGTSPHTLVLLSENVKVVVDQKEKRVLTVAREGAQNGN